MGRCKYLLCAVGLNAMTCAYALESYSATYDVSIRGISAGTARHDVIVTDNTFRFDSVAQPAAAARMLGYGVIYESVKGLREGERVQPQHYQRSMEGDSDYRLDYTFKPKQHKIEAQIGSAHKTLTYAEGLYPQDVLSLVLQTLLDYEQHRVAKQYTLVTDETVGTYRVEQRPDETWQTQSGQYITVHVYNQINGARQTRVYFAEKPLRLVKLTQMKDGEPNFSLELLSHRVL